VLILLPLLLLLLLTLLVQPLLTLLLLPMLLLLRCCRALRATTTLEHTVALKVQQEMRLSGFRPTTGVLVQLHLQYCLKTVSAMYWLLLFEVSFETQLSYESDSIIFASVTGT
jgi:hypothetical protein